MEQQPSDLINDPLDIICKVLGLTKSDDIERQVRPKRLRQELGASAAQVAEMVRLAQTLFEINMPAPEDILTVNDFLYEFRRAFGGRFL
jgi:hypothetical protein